MINRKKPNNSFQVRFLVSLKMFLYIEDIMNLANISYSKAHRIKSEIIAKKHTLYPIPTEIVMDHLGISEEKLERAAMKEKKLFGNKKESTGTDSNKM